MSNIVNIIYFILILSVIIIVHELGHLIAAKRFGVYCKEFSIGMGPVVYQKQVGETAWSIRALPIGGFVAMAGEEDDDEAEELDIPYERTLNGIKPWKQIVVMAAGCCLSALPRIRVLSVSRERHWLPLYRRIPQQRRVE